MTEFDPYLEWLGIRPEERPLTYYRLLGIPDFESNPDVIETAVRKRAEKLRSVLTGDKQQTAQEIIKNIAKAKACLLNVQQKELYDKKLRAALQPSKPSTEPKAEFEVNLLSDEDRKVSTSRWMMMPAVVAVVTVIIVVVSLMQPEEGKQVSTTTDPADSTTTDPADSTTTDPADSTTTDPADSTTTDPADSTTTDPADSTTTDPADSTTTDPADSTTTSSVTSAYTTPVNWIKRVIPPLAERDLAVTRLEVAFQDETEKAKAEGPLAQAALADRIFQLSNGYVLTDPDTDWAELFAVLQFSYLMARDSGSKLQTDIVRDRLDVIFSVDLLALRLGECQVWEKLVLRDPMAPHHAGFVDLTGPLSYMVSYDQFVMGDTLPVLYEEIAFQAESQQRYDFAAQAYEGLIRLQRTVAGRVGVGPPGVVDLPFEEIVVELKGRVASWKTGQARAVVAQQRFLDYQRALELLKQDPQDPTASRNAGIYLAFNRGNWHEGCRYLANGPAEPLTVLAKLELRQLNPVVPNSVSAIQSLGDGWTDYGQQEAALVDRRPVYFHASDWYERAMKVTNSPLDKVELENKIAALAKLDVNVAVDPVAGGEKLFDRIILNTKKAGHSWNVAIPAGLIAQGCSLEITKLQGFPGETKIPKQMVAAGGEILILLNGPARIKFRVRFEVGKDGLAKIGLRSSGQKVVGGSTNAPLDLDELEKAIAGQMKAIEKANGNLASLQALLPKYKQFAERAKGTAAAPTAQTNVRTCQRRIAGVPRTIADCEKRIARFIEIRRILTTLHGTAEIHFKIVPTPNANN